MNIEAGKEYRGTDMLDLIEPWTDRPEVNWAAMPAWAKWVAMDQCGDWYWHEAQPRKLRYEWGIDTKGDCGRIHSDYAPKFTGDWKDSLVERP